LGAGGLDLSINKIARSADRHINHFLQYQQITITGDKVIGLTHYGVGEQVVVFGIACHRGDGFFDAEDDFATEISKSD
jgi:hypothetical protein